MLEKAGLTVKVLQMRGAQDPDEFLKKYGADRFKLLLEESSNRVEYQLRAIAKKHDLKSDEDRVAFIGEASEFVSTLQNAFQREIYGKRAAEAAGISYDAMKIEVEKAFKRKLYRDKKKQERIDLDPARKLQPKSRNFHYDNMRSAMAEEGVLSLIVREPAMLELSRNLEPENFSCPLLGKVYGELRDQYRQGQELSASGLQDLQPDEMSHVAGILQRHQGPVSEQAFEDCVRIILSENQSAHIESDEDMMDFQRKMRERKGIRG